MIKRFKLKKYFPEAKVVELVVFLKTIGEVHSISIKHNQCRDPKDNFLLDLIEKSKAEYLVTGDKIIVRQNKSWQVVKVMVKNNNE